MTLSEPVDNDADDLSDSEPEDLWNRVQRCLLEAGLVSEIKPPITDFTPWEDRRPLNIPGKPLSEILIEERR